MSNNFGWRVYGLGIASIGLLGLALRDFVSENVPAGFPGRAALIYVVAVFLLVAGVAVVWRRTTPWAAAAITAYFAIVVALLMDGPGLLADYWEYGPYEGIAEPVALAAGGLVVFASSADLDAALRARLIRIGQIVFGICAIIFGGAHFAYMNLTAPMIPKWLPPSQVFWGFVTGVCQMAAGMAILTCILFPRLAAILLAVMYALFVPLVFVPILTADPTNHFRWGELVATLALIGVAWVMADSFAQARR